MTLAQAKKKHLEWLRKPRVYRDKNARLALQRNEYLLGYKGATFFEGPLIVAAPFIPMMP